MANHLRVVESLLRLGANVDNADQSGATPLWHAAEQGHLAVLNCLLAAGADKNRPDRTGTTPLHAAVNACRPGAVSLLLGKGADFGLPDAHGSTALVSAASGGQLGLVKLLLRVDQSSVAAEGGSPALLAAAGHGHLPVVKYLLRKGATNGIAALVIANERNHKDVVSYLAKFLEKIHKPEGEETQSGACLINKDIWLKLELKMYSVIAISSPHNSGKFASLIYIHKMANVRYFCTSWLPVNELIHSLCYSACL